MKKLIIISAVLACIIASCNPYGSEISDKLNGCWINPETGEWKYGFFEEFAIYNNDFWRYYSVSDNQIVLYKDTATQEFFISEKVLPDIPDSQKSFISFSFLNDSVLEIDGKRYQKNDYSRFSYHKGFDFYGCAEYLLQKFQNRTDVEVDTTDFEPHSYDFAYEDTCMVFRYYHRNTAKGFNSLERRFAKQQFWYEVETNFTSFDYMGRLYGPSWIDTLSHYGCRFECPLFGAPMMTIESFRLFQYGDFSHDVPYFIEKNDTMMFLANQETFRNDRQRVLRCEHYAMGGNSRYIQEQDALYYYVLINHKGEDPLYYNCMPYRARNDLGDSAFFAQRYNIYVGDTTLLYNFIKDCKVPLSYKFKRFNRNFLFNSFANDVIGCKEADEFFAQDLHLNEDDIMLFPQGGAFIVKYVVYKDSIQYCKSFPGDTLAHIAVTPENMQKYPDYIPYRCNNNPVLINPQMVKDLGFSSEFFDWCVFICASQYLSGYYKSDDPDTFSGKWLYPSVEEYEIDHLTRIVKEPYAELLQDRIKWNNDGENHY